MDSYFFCWLSADYCLMWLVIYFSGWLSADYCYGRLVSYFYCWLSAEVLSWMVGQLFLLLWPWSITLFVLFTMYYSHSLWRERQYVPCNPTLPHSATNTTFESCVNMPCTARTRLMNYASCWHIHIYQLRVKTQHSSTMPTPGTLLIC